MKIKVAQINTYLGNIEKNFKNALEIVKENKANILIFPQNFLSGYPNSEILKCYPHLVEKELEYLKKLAKEVKNFNVLASFEDKFALLNNGEIKKIINSGESIEIEGKKFGVLNELYKKHIFSDMPDFIVIAASSITKTGEEFKKNQFLSNFAKEAKTPVIYVNQTGAQDILIYEGASRIYDKNGKIAACADFFKDDFLEIEENDGVLKGTEIAFEQAEFCKDMKEFSLDYTDDLKRTYKAVILAIKDYFDKNGFKHAVLGLSGGIDSAVCAALLAHALGADNVLGVLMPTKISSKESIDYSVKLSENLKIQYIKIPVKEEVECFKGQFANYFKNINFKKYEKSYTTDNIQARTRAMVLWGISNEFEAMLPIATCDKSEDFVGYSTINGDMSGGFAPIGDITKTKLKALAAWINRNGEIIPQAIIDKKPTAELEIKDGNYLCAEDALMPYEFMDEAIWRFENKGEFIEDMMKTPFIYEKTHNINKTQKLIWLEKFFKRLQNARYKQFISPPVPVIDTKSLSTDYKCPICAKFIR